MNVTQTCRDIKELTPQAQKACGLFLSECKKQGLNVLITETYRSQERQDYLYQQGRTRQGKIVTWTRNSRHTSRRAWDICKNVKGKEYSDSNFFRQCGEIAAELGITWGGIWKSSPDTPHFEIPTNWKLPAVSAKVDKELFDAASELYKNSYISVFNAWKRVDLIQLESVPALVCKLAKIKLDGDVTVQQYKQAIDKLVLNGFISQRKIWDERTYTVNNVRSLIIKFSKSV